MLATTYDTKKLELPIADFSTGRIDQNELLAVFQAAIDNGDILEPANEFCVIASVMPLVDQGLLTRSAHVDTFRERTEKKPAQIMARHAKLNNMYVRAVFVGLGIILLGLLIRWFG